jgi:Zn-dependent alcohol dehydrogenase
MKGEDELCEDFSAYNRAKGTLYDGETRLFLRSSGKYAFLCLTFAVYGENNLI